MSIRSSVLLTSLAVLTNLVAACDREPLSAPPSPTQVPDIRASTTIAWQQEAHALIASNNLTPPAAGRIFAALSLAQAYAAQSVDVAPTELDPAGGGYGPGGRAEFEAQRAAVAAASADVLSFIFPAAAAALDQKLADMMQGDLHPEFARGIAAGEVAAATIIDHLRNDGFTKPFAGPVLSGPGYWIPNSLPPAGGTLGYVTPYFLESGSQFRPDAPPAFGTDAFLADLNEVVRFTNLRTPAQLALAIQWDFPTGTSTTVGYWNRKATEYIVESNLDDGEAARVFGLMHGALFDAQVACWDAKYTYWTIRPYQVPPTGAVQVAIARPNHPSYPSGHSCLSAASARVLEELFPAKANELNQLVTDAGISRIYAGLHYRFDVTAGQVLGRQVAEWAIAKGL
jgi:membrane-associated phospholipid phosphatase